MKNILFIISGIHKLGGSERVAISLANELSKTYNITIISRKYNVSKPAYELSPTVNIIQIKGSNFNFIKEIKKYLKTHSTDYVVIHTMSKLTPILLLANIKANSIWSLEHISFEAHATIYKLLRKLLYRKLDKILVFTESQKKIFLPINKNVEVIKNPSPFPISDKPYNTKSTSIISIGSLEHRKGFDMLIKSWAKLYKRYPEWSLHIYGEGEEKDNLQSEIDKLEINNIKLEGSTTNTLPVYDNAAIYVMTSRFEGLPMVLIESQARGVPIVSYDCPTGPKEIIKDGKNGILVSPNDILKLTESIELLINNPTIRVNMSNQSRIQAEQFSLSQVVTHWINLIESK